MDGLRDTHSQADQDGAANAYDAPEPHSYAGDDQDGHAQSRCNRDCQDHLDFHSNRSEYANRYGCA